MCYLSQGGKETQLSQTERAQRDKNTRTQHTDSEHKLYLSVCSLDWPDGRIMFCTRVFVCSFVRLLPTCERYTSKTNAPISMQLGINLPPGQGYERSTSGVRRSKVKVTGGRSYVWKPGGEIILDPLSWVDRGIQWATEMLPLKRGDGVYASCWRTYICCFYLCGYLSFLG